MKRATKKETEIREARSPIPTRTPHEQLAREAAEWDKGSRTPVGFEDAPDALPRASESKPVSLRLPVTLLEILKRFAEHERVGYQVLIKRWLDDRVRAERDRLRAARAAAASSKANGCGERMRRRVAPCFPIVDRPDGESGHYQQRV